MAYNSKSPITVAVGAGGAGGMGASLNTMSTNAYVTADEFKKLAEKVAALQADLNRITKMNGYVIQEMEL